ncbi:RPN1 [Cordylochernes scorpioides]|uniref:Dolichyl-diphosphooligosaccharide--protein glycosyltransferase subunit 1 n=1 Tax=Cordylochernes scorpioides TaxID=51811 RepID=A0ABY6K969_9ARAC|nr:RPN1 [Cordylochernes scorpioides]
MIIMEADGTALKWAESSVNKDQRSYQRYDITLNGPLSAGSSRHMVVHTVLTKYLRPYPSHVSQTQKQLVVYEDSHVVPTVHPCRQQQTSVVLPSPSSVESYSRNLKPAAHSDDTITYGPYENIAPYSYDKMLVHYENNRPFLAVTRMERDVEVSHWGVISVEEKINMEHVGASLNGPFSRYDYQQQRGEGASVRSWRTVLPASAADVYYRDDIGNISTSHLRTHVDSVEVELRPRFPLFGGWKTFYTLGYTVPTYEYLYTSGENYILRMRFVDHVFDDSIIDDAYVRIILPEGSRLQEFMLLKLFYDEQRPLLKVRFSTSNASQNVFWSCRDILVKLPYGATRLPDQVHYTYLDTMGRPVVALHKSNLVEQHIAEMEVHYKFDSILLLQEPLLVVAALYLLFLAVVVYVRLDFTISPDPQREGKLRAAGLSAQCRDTQDRRTELYTRWEAAIAKLRATKDAGAFQTSLRNLGAEHRTLTQNMTDLAAKLKAESAAPEILDKVQEIQKLDKQLKEQLQLQGSQLEKLVASKLSKQQYLEQDTVVAKRKEELAARLSSLTFQL